MKTYDVFVVLLLLVNFASHAFGVTIKFSLLRNPVKTVGDEITEVGGAGRGDIYFKNMDRLDDAVLPSLRRQRHNLKSPVSKNYAEILSSRTLILGSRKSKSKSKQS